MLSKGERRQCRLCSRRSIQAYAMLLDAREELATGLCLVLSSPSVLSPIDLVCKRLQRFSLSLRRTAVHGIPAALYNVHQLDMSLRAKGAARSRMPRKLNSPDPSPPHNMHKLSAHLRTRRTNPNIQEDLSGLFRWYFGAEVGQPTKDSSFGGLQRPPQ